MKPGSPTITGLFPLHAVVGCNNVCCHGNKQYHLQRLHLLSELLLSPQQLAVFDALLLREGQSQVEQVNKVFGVVQTQDMLVGRT